MQVNTSQLREGYILLKEVTGKSGHPIMKENTVLTNEHITILHKFLIDKVNVSTNQLNHIKNETEKETQDNVRSSKTISHKKEISSFHDHYLQVVSSFRKEFEQWNQGMPIDISNIRNILIPLLERIDEVESEVFTLHDYVQAETYIYHHSVAVSVMAAFIGKEQGFSKGEWLQIGLAGLLCDAGMTRVDETIITKVGPLTEKQLEDIKNHPIYSSRMVADLPAITPSVKVAILQHHERMDGSGYPLGLSGDKINPYARILAVSDTYHAMLSERLYKSKRAISKVIAELQTLQYSKLDQEIVQLLIKHYTSYSLGKLVHLSDGTIGEVVFIDEKNPSKPFIKLYPTEEIISLQDTPQIYIEAFKRKR